MNDKQAARCDHKFVDSDRCLKCGWRPFCGDKKLSHAGCCEPDPNLKLSPDGERKGDDRT